MYPKPGKAIPALYGGIIIALLSAIPFVNIITYCCCAGVIIGGILAVKFYKDDFTPETPPFTTGDCMAVGALAGLIGAVIGTVLSAIFFFAFGEVSGEFVLEWLRNSNVELPQEFWDSLEQSIEEGLTIASVALSLFISLLFYPLFGLLGGLIGYSIFKPKPQFMPPPPAHTPLPM